MAMSTKLKIKKGDTVMVVSGKEKGKKGPVIEVRPKDGRVVVEGLNMAKRHLRAVGKQSGRIAEKPMPIHVSNVMLLDPEKKAPTRVGTRMEGEKKVRFAKKSGSTLK